MNVLACLWCMPLLCDCMILYVWLCYPSTCTNFHDSDNKVFINNFSLDQIYVTFSKIRCNTIIKDSQHPLNNSYQLLPSGRRFQSLKCRTSRYSNSFLPSSIRILNNDIPLSVWMFLHVCDVCLYCVIVWFCMYDYVMAAHVPNFTTVIIKYLLLLLLLLLL